MSMNLSGPIQLAPNSSGALGNPGQVVRVYNIQSTGLGSTSETYLYNGATSSGRVVVLSEIITPAKAGPLLHFEQGLRFPSGCYYVTDANCSGGFIEFDTEL